MEDSLRGLYSFLGQAYGGNWQYRWQNTPFLEEATKSGHTESVAGHEWAAMEFWFNLRRLCPNLDSIVDSIEVYEILLNHDLGETRSGDVPFFQKYHGVVDDKEAERACLEELCSSLPKTRDELLAWFDEFEKDVVKINSLEVLVAKWVDTLQADHFGLTFGKKLPEYSKPINGILQMRFVAITNRLIEVLDKNGLGALNEVRQVAKYHVSAITAAGISFDSSKLNV